MKEGSHGNALDKRASGRAFRFKSSLLRRSGLSSSIPDALRCEPSASRSRPTGDERADARPGKVTLSPTG
nr:MAG TPA: hypothetical protein [Microviridae sp.]